MSLAPTVAGGAVPSNPAKAVGELPRDPKFRLGHPVLWNKYFDVTPRAEAHRSHPDDLRETVIVGVRLLPEATEDDEGNAAVTYPKGWEYKLGNVLKRDGGFVWVTEAELLAEGYQAVADLLDAATRGLSFIRHALEFFSWERFPELHAEVQSQRDIIAAAVVNAGGAA